MPLRVWICIWLGTQSSSLENYFPFSSFRKLGNWKHFLQDIEAKNKNLYQKETKVMSKFSSIQLSCDQTGLQSRTWSIQYNLIRVLMFLSQVKAVISWRCCGSKLRKRRDNDQANNLPSTLPLRIYAQFRIRYTLLPFTSFQLRLFSIWY